MLFSRGAMMKELLPVSRMSEEQLRILLARIKEDPGLRAKLDTAKDLDVAQSIVKEAGFEVDKRDWLSYQASQVCDLDDNDLEVVAGGKGAEPCQKTSGAICMMI
jgi:predicted ribosomally synthesized peptide with nif11-like leader